MDARRSAVLGDEGAAVRRETRRPPLTDADIDRCFAEAAAVIREIRVQITPVLGLPARLRRMRIG